MLTITLSAAGYTAVFAPANGGAILSLKKGDTEIFHHLGTDEQILAKPTSYGLPLLFPPNRLDGGTFTFEGVKTTVPITEPARNTSCHGFLHTRPWQVAGYQESEDTAEIHLVFEGDESTDFYQNYPYEFEAELIYKIDKDGLHQQINLTNLSGKNMPYGLGWHSAFALPGWDLNKAKDAKVRVSVGKRIMVDDRMLPTGEVKDLIPEEAEFRSEAGGSPLFRIMDDHYTVEPIERDGKPFHGAVLTDPDGRYEVVYRVDDFYKHWMIWNCRQEGSFICIEPQNWRINAPNLDLPREESGLDVLADQETRTICADVCLNELK